jgi:hypothetical protein
MTISYQRTFYFLEKYESFSLVIFFAFPLIKNLAHSGLKKICHKQNNKLSLQNTIDCTNGPFSKKAQNLCDVTQYANAECQVTKHIYNLAMNLVTLKYQYLNCNNSVNSASVIKLFYHFGMRWTHSIT